MPANDSIIKQWIPNDWLTCSHQVEESISFFSVVSDNVAKNSSMVIKFQCEECRKGLFSIPDISIVASMVQISLAIAVAYIQES